MSLIYKKLLGLVFALSVVLYPVASQAATKLLFNGTSSGTMYLSAPPVASGTIILPTLSGGTAYLIDGTRKISTTSPLTGGGALSGDLSLALDLSATYNWKGTQNATKATSILPNSLGLPSTCPAGSIYVNLSGSTSQKLFVCETTNTWVAVGASTASSTLPNNFTSNTNPVATDDTPTYSVGSRWINTTDDTQFVAVDVTSTAARWFRTDIGNARFSGTRKGGVLDLNYYNMAGSTADLATQINFWTNSYASPGNTVADTTIERASGDNGLLKIVNQGDGDFLLQSGNSFYVDLDSDNDSYATKVFNIRSDIPGTSTAVTMASFRDDGGLILDNSRETEYFSNCYLEADDADDPSLTACLYAALTLNTTSAFAVRGASGNICSTRSYNDCLNNTCQGGTNNGNSCANDRDCPPAVAGTSCTTNAQCATNYECRPYMQRTFDVATEAPLGKYCTSSQYCTNNRNSTSATVSSDCDQTVAQYCISTGGGPYMSTYATDPYRGLLGNGAQVGKYIFYTNKGTTSYEDVARVEVIASQPHTTSALGSTLILATVPNDSTQLQYRFQIRGDGTSTWSSDNVTDGVQMDATGKLYKDGSGKIEADQLATTITTASTSETAVELTTDHSFSYVLDNDTDATAYFTVREGSAKDYVLTVATDGRFIAQVPNASSTGGNGIVMSNAGVLTKQNSGSIVADALSGSVSGATAIYGGTAAGSDLTIGGTSNADGTGSVFKLSQANKEQIQIGDNYRGYKTTISTDLNSGTNGSLSLNHVAPDPSTTANAAIAKLEIGTFVGSALGTRTAATDNDDYLGLISFTGATSNSGADSGAAIWAQASQTWTTSVGGTDLHFLVNPNGSNTTQSRFVINGDRSSTWSIDNNVNGVEMTTAGILQKRGTGSVVADKVSGDGAETIVEATGSGADLKLKAKDQVIVYLDTDDTSAGAASFVIVGSDTGSTISAVYENGTQYLISDFAEGGTSSNYPLFISRFQDTTAGVACTSGSCVNGMRAGSSCTVVADCLMTDNNQHLMKLSAYGQATTSAGDKTTINTGTLGFQATEDWVRGACSSTTATKCTIDSQCPSGEYCANSSVGTDFYIRSAKEQHMQTRFVLYGSEGSATSNSGIWTAGSSTQQVQPAGGDPGPGVALRQDGRLVGYNAGSIQADKLNSSITADSAVNVATGTNADFTIDPNGTGIVIVNSVGLKTIHTTPSAATHWIGRSEDHGIAFDSTVSYNPILQSADDIYILTDTNNNGGNDNVYFRSNALSGGTSIQFAKLGTGGAEIKPDGTNGVSMTGAGLLAKAGTGSIVADKASNNGALTIETTASNGDIKLTPHGTGQVIVYGDTPTGQVGASGTVVITDDDTTSVQLALTSNLAGTTTPSTLTMLKRNGTTSVVAGEQLSRITSYGYENVGTAANKIAGTIGFDANQAFNDSQAGSNFVLGLTGDGANTLETRFKILGDGSSYLTKDSGVNGVEMTTDGYLQKKGTGRIISDYMASTVTSAGTGYQTFTSPNTIRMIVDNDDNATAQFEVREGAGNNLVMAVFDSGKLILVDDAETNTTYSTLVSGTLEVNSGGTGGSMDADAIAVNRTADDANGVYFASGRARGTTGCSGGNTHCLAKTGDVLFMDRHFGRGDSSANYANGTCSTTTGTSCTSDANCPGSETCIHAGMIETARVSIKADGDWTPTNAGSMFSVQLQPSGVAPSASFGNTQVRFRLRADGSGQWTKDNLATGVELTTDGYLQKRGAGKVIADSLASIISGPSNVGTRIESFGDHSILIDRTNNGPEYGTFRVMAGGPSATITNNIVMAVNEDGSFVFQTPAAAGSGNGVQMNSSGSMARKNSGSIVADKVTNALGDVIIESTVSNGGIRLNPNGSGGIVYTKTVGNTHFDMRQLSTDALTGEYGGRLLLSLAGATGRQVNETDVLGTVDFRGSDDNGTTFDTGVQLGVSPSDEWTSSDHRSNFFLKVVPNGSTSLQNRIGVFAGGTSYWTSDSAGKGVEMTVDGYLQKRGTGSIIADKVSKNNTLTIETTLNNGNINIVPHGSGDTFITNDVNITKAAGSPVMLSLETQNAADASASFIRFRQKTAGDGFIDTGDQLGKLIFYGWADKTTDAYEESARILVTATDNYATTATGSDFDIQTTRTGTNTQSSRFKLLGDGTSEWTTNGNVGVQMDANGRLTRRTAGGRIEATDVSGTYGLTVGAGGYIGSNPNFGLQWPSAGTSVSLTTANDFLVLLDNNNNANADEFVIYDGGQTPGSADGNGNTAEEIFSIGHVAGMTIRPDKTNGVTMTAAGVLSRLNAGSIVADKVSKATAVTIETTAGDSSITLNTHGDGSILNYGITQIEVDYPTQSNTPLVLQQNNAAAGGATTLQLRKRHPTNAQGDNEPIGAIRFYGTRNTSGTVSESAGIWTQAGEDWTDTAVGTDMLFRVTPNGSGPGTGNARFSLYSDGSSRWTKDDQTNGVTLTSAGYLQKFGTGSVIADKVSSATAVTIETTASNANITLDPHGTGSVNIPASNPLVLGNTNYTNPAITVDGATDTGIQFPSDDSSVALVADGGFTSAAKGSVLLVQKTRTDLISESPALLQIITRDQDALSGGSNGGQLALSLSSVASGGRNPNETDILGRIDFKGSPDEAVSYYSGARIMVDPSDEWVDGSNYESDLKLATVLSGQTTLSDRLTILSNGYSSWTKDNNTNGVEMTTAGVLQKKGTGCIVQADRISFGTVSSDDTACTTGEVKFDATYTYFCVDGSSASQKWKRIAMSSDTW
jgi:hypothetical protein